MDIGSASSKAVILKNGKIAAACAVPFGTGSTGPEKALSLALKQAKIDREDIAYTVATGYGRGTYKAADKQYSEISCHAKGVFYLTPDARTIIDIGGQDAKAISLEEDGRVGQFFMNEKCARGRDASSK
jgi:predicted CoA-substrate-specific enzyme activase